MSMRELIVPAEALEDEKATEVLRAWIAHEQLYCVLKPEGFDDVGAWGILLADVARHIANGLAEARGLDEGESLQRIRESFEAEFEQPTGQRATSLTDDENLNEPAGSGVLFREIPRTAAGRHETLSIIDMSGLVVAHDRLRSKAANDARGCHPISGGNG